MKFGKERRVRRRSDYLRIQNGARRVTCAHFVFLVAPSPESATPARLGLIVTRKVGNAVARNRIKRVCRACFRLSPGFVPDGIDLVVVARAGADALALSAVQAEWAGIRPALVKRCAQALAQAPRVPHLRPR